MINIEALREKIANTIVTTRGHNNVGSVGNYVGTPVLNAIMETIANEFEEVEEFQEWRPEEGEVYKFLYSNGGAMSMSFDGREIDQHYLSIGNCYPANTPNGVIIKEQKLIPQAMYRLKMAAKEAWFEFDGSEGADWGDCRSCHWRHFICFDRETYRFYVNGDDYQQIAGVVYFPTEESAQAYIDSNKDDLELLFGVEQFEAEQKSVRCSTIFGAKYGGGKCFKDGKEV